MNKNYLLKLAQYNIWANDLMAEWLDQISDNQWSTKLVGSMESIAATAIHIAGAEKIWHERLINMNNAPLVSYFEGSKSDLISIWKEVSKNLYLLVCELSEDEIMIEFSYQNMKGDYFSSKKFEALTHVFNHSTYHRGQIVNYLRQVGFTDVSSTDLITYFRKNPI